MFPQRFCNELILVEKGKKKSAALIERTIKISPTSERAKKQYAVAARARVYRTCNRDHYNRARGRFCIKRVCA